MPLFSETIPQQESEKKEAVAQSVRARIHQLYGEKRALRDTHVKTHACVEATLDIHTLDEHAILSSIASAANLSPEQAAVVKCKLGLFAQAKQYNCLLRFANGTVKTDSDKRLDARSMSIKIFGVQGPHLDESYDREEQDIIVQNAPIFFVRGIDDYHSFFEVAGKAMWRMGLWFLRHPYQAWCLFRTVRRRPESLLTEKYWSGSVSSLGEAIANSQTAEGHHVTYPLLVKYIFTPVSPHAPFQTLPYTKRGCDVPENYYREDIISRLARPAAKYCWDMQLQVQTDTCQSVEDVTIDWPEEDTVNIHVGRLTITSQAIDAQAQFEQGEALRFSPWNGLTVHRPVGQLNRFRGFIYPIVAKLRLNSKGSA